MFLKTDWRTEYILKATSFQMFEHNNFLTPAEKHMLVKVMGFCLFLIDSDQVI